MFQTPLAITGTEAQLKVKKPKTSGVIYMITSPTKRIYIGQTIDLKSRVYAYKIHKGTVCKQRLLYKSIIKHSWAAHSIAVIEEVPISELNEREIYWIDYYKSFIYKYKNSRGMNLTIGGNAPMKDRKGVFSAMWGRKMSEKVKEALCASARLRVGEKNSKSKRVYQYNLKGDFIESHVSATIVAKKNNWLQANICSCCLGNKPSAYKYMWFFEYKGEKISPFKKPPTGGPRKIIQIDKLGNQIGEFESITEACLTLNINKTTAHKYLNNKIVNPRKYTFKYK